MKTKIDNSWDRYAIIAELTRRLDIKSTQFGKTALQKLIYFLQAIYQIDCGYDFRLYSYGPFDSQLLGDLDILEHWGYVTITHLNDSFGGYQIKPTEYTESILNKASDFLARDITRNAIDDLISLYGQMNARELELRATTVYVAHDLKTKKRSPSKDNICKLVGEIKPKFTKQEIEQVVDELSQRNHISFTT